MKLKDAEKLLVTMRRQFEREKTINRGGIIKEEFWTKAQKETRKIWTEGKSKNQVKADRLENTFKGARSYTGMVGNIRVGDRELGEEEGEPKEPLTAGIEVTESEAKVLTKDPRFRDWCKIEIEDIETDIAIGLDNMRREMRKVEENGGKSLSRQEEENEKQFTEVLNLENKTMDYGKMRSTAMKENKYFEMSRAVNRKDELTLQRLNDKLVEASRTIIRKTQDNKGFPVDSCYTVEEVEAIKSLKRKKKQEGAVICGTDKSQMTGVMSEEEWLGSLAPHTREDPEVTIGEVEEAEKKLMGVAFSLASGQVRQVWGWA